MLRVFVYICCLGLSFLFYFIACGSICKFFFLHLMVNIKGVIDDLSNPKL